MCVGPAVLIDKDGDQSQRVFGNADVDLIQNVFTTTLNQVQSLQEPKLSVGPAGFGRRSKDVLCYAARQHLQLQAKVCVFSRILFDVSAECVPNMNDLEKFCTEGNGYTQFLSELMSYFTYTALHEKNKKCNRLHRGHQEIRNNFISFNACPCL